MNKSLKGFFVVAGLILFFIAVFWLFNGGFDFFLQFTSLNQRIQSTNLSSNINNEIANFNLTFGSSMINYTDYEYGFTIQYPKGYFVNNSNLYDNDTVFYFTASTFFAHFPEVLTVDVLNGTTGENEYDNALNSLGSIVNNLKGTGYVNNYYLLTFDFFANSTSLYGVNETVLGREAFFDCKTLLGEPYVAIITFFTPRISESDLALSDYTFSTFRC